ncbi:MAG: hypothetical protein QGH15_23075, partial [Kiritimatiellia bacterium]|nr:hypothetical protein [Kiritimatiellia bacterium]
MDFVIIANAWSAGADNPTSKHRIALELARRGNRILWLEGAGMRSPSISSGSDRGRIIRKIALSLRGARVVKSNVPTHSHQPSLAEASSSAEATADKSEGKPSTLRRSPSYGGQAINHQPSPTGTAGDIWVLTPLPIPLPRFGIVRCFNGWLYRILAKRWAGRIGFNSPILINYVPV